MGWASASGHIGVQLAYSDTHQLWTNPHVVKLIELLAIEFMENDWDTEDECYDSKTFQIVCQQSKHKYLQHHWKYIKERLDARQEDPEE